MEPKPLSELRVVAEVEVLPPGFLTLPERLERWAKLLEREGRGLTSLDEIDLAPQSQRRLMRADNSPLSVAFADPHLRASGLASDCLGDAMAFFGLTEDEAHRLLCSCLHGRTIDGRYAARMIRRHAGNENRSLSVGWAFAGFAAAAPVVLFLAN